LVSNSQWGPTYVQVTDCVTDRWGTHLVCAVLGERQGECETVHSVGPVDMKGIGWKLASEAEVTRMARYIEVA
jgi:hypothetical protein